eukprot:gb/GFBE01007554.1/.p1 GENE.gb/GFBE01007554.1/~~gb/GFBE01007554.1/.p1  ORF type:complete len:1418 (+),score=289.08 gb/GFBE01007554.1/:1-4254(+)
MPTNGNQNIRKRVSEPFIQRGLESLRKIYFFKHCKDPFLKNLVGRLQPTFLAPEEILAREGEVCDRILFMGKGSCEAFIKGTVVKTYEDGAVIGPQLALLTPLPFEQTVTTNGFSDFMVLHRQDLLDVLATHTVIAAKIHRVAFSRQMHEQLVEKRNAAIKKRQLTRELAAGSKSADASSKAKQSEASPKSADASNAKSPKHTGTASFPKRSGSFPKRDEPSATDGHTAAEPAGEPAGEEAASKPKIRPKLRSLMSISILENMAEEGKTKTREKHDGAVHEMTEVCFGQEYSEAWDTADTEYVAALAEEENEAVRRGMASWLDGIDFFSNMDSFSLEKILKLVKKRSFTKGQQLLTEGEPAEALHILYAGNVHITLRGKAVTKLGPKSILGEKSICVLGADVMPCGATILAASQLVVTLSLPRESLLELFIKDDAIYEHFRKKFDIERVKRGLQSFRNVKLLEASSPEFVHHLESKVSQVVLQPGETLFQQGQPNDTAYLLCRGSVDILRNDVAVSALDVSDMSDAVIFGEFNVLGIWRAPKATVAARSNCLFKRITPEILRECFNEFPDDSRVFRRLVERRLEDDLSRQATAKTVSESDSEEESEDDNNDEANEDKRDDEDDEDNEDDGGDEDDEGDEEGEDENEDPQSAMTSVEEEDGEYQPPVINVAAVHMGTADGDATLSQDAPEQEPEDKDAAGATAAENANSNLLRTESVMSVSRAESCLRADSHVASGTFVLGDDNSESEEEMAALDHNPLVQRYIRRMTKDDDLIYLPCNLGDIAGFHDLDPDVVHEFEALMKPRVYLPQQVVLQQGTDMSHIIVLQRGSCSVEVFGADLEPMEGPCILGGFPSLVTKKVFTTVIADDTCFVGAIPKHSFARVLNAHPEARRHLLVQANGSFKRLCDEFQEQMQGDESLQKQLSHMPFLQDASEPFLSSLAAVVEPRLLLPGQEVGGATDEDGQKLYILFEGHLHVMLNGNVVATMSPKMVAGLLDVFGVQMGTTPVVIKSDELCKVGTLSKTHLFELFEQYPHERHRFENLVHNILDSTISKCLIQQPIFAGMPSQFLQKVNHLLERRLVNEDAVLIRENEPGDKMLILNLGKAEVSFRGLAVNMLWPGKAFGGAQMVGLHRTYHASVQAKKTCHALYLSREQLHSLIPHGAERPWVRALRKRCEITYQQELRYFNCRHTQHRLFVKSGVSTASHTASLFVDILSAKKVFQAWQEYVENLKGQRITLESESPEAMAAPSSEISKDSKERLAVVAEDKSTVPEPKRPIGPRARRQSSHATRPLQFSRGLSRVFDCKEEQVARPDAKAEKPREQRPTTPKLQSHLVQLAQVMKLKDSDRPPPEKLTLLATEALQLQQAQRQRLASQAKHGLSPKSPQAGSRGAPWLHRIREEMFEQIRTIQTSGYRKSLI